jgi:hypothetical protein
MLDRRAQPNIFDPQRDGGGAETEDDQLLRSFTSAESSSASERTQRIPRSRVATTRVLRRGRWGNHVDRLRRGARFLPLGVMLVLLLTRSEGCSGKRTIEATSTTATAPSPTVTPTGPAHPITEVRTPIRPVPARTLHGRRSPRAGRSRVPRKAPRRKVSGGMRSAKGPPEITGARTVVSTRTVSASSPSFTSAPPPEHLRRETGAEFGFEH